MDFLNVGQGDSAFIETPENYHILIDGGPDSTVLLKLGKILPFWDKKIDLIILTHPESDHMTGLMDVLQKYKVDYILWTGVKKTALEYDKWINLLNAQKKIGAKIIIAQSGQEIKMGNVLIDTIYPLESLEGKEMKNTSNDSCIVSKLIFGKNSFDPVLFLQVQYFYFVLNILLFCTNFFLLFLSCTEYMDYLQTNLC